MIVGRQRNQQIKQLQVRDEANDSDKLAMAGVKQKKEQQVMMRSTSKNLACLTTQSVNKLHVI